MKKNLKSALSFLFVLIFMLQIAGMTAVAEYDPSVTGEEPLAIAVYIPVKDESGNVSSALLNYVDVNLPEGSVLGLTIGDTPLSSGSVIRLGDLMTNDLDITPPDGYYVTEAYLYAGELAYDQSPASLEGEAYSANLEGTAVKLKKENFIDEDTGYFDSSRLCNTGSSYVLLLRLGLTEDVETVTVSYSGGEAYVPVPEAQAAGVGTVFTVAGMDATVEGKVFTGWRLTYGSGVVVDVSVGSPIQPYADCTLVAQWDDAVAPVDPVPVDPVPVDPVPVDPGEHEHNWVETGSVAATCTEDGVRYLTCSICNEATSQVIPATGHSYGEVVVTKPATCTEEGTTAQTCANCGDVLTAVIPATGHSYGEVVVTKPATCTEEGTTAQTCANCGDVLTAVIPATGHSYGEVVVTKPATCTEEGTTAQTCANCGDVLTAVIPATGHAWNEGEVTTPATCETAGVKTFTCQNDPSHTRTEEIPATGHAWNEGEVTTPATCVAPGVKTFTCQNDPSHTKTEEIPATGQHSYVENVVAPTYEAEGYTEHTCSVCGDYYRDNIQPKLERKVLPAPAMSAAKWTKGSGAAFTLTVDHDISTFSSVLLNGNLLTKDTDYSARQGSTVIELKPETLEKLNAGTAKVEIVFTDAVSTGEFTIENPPAPEKSSLTVRPKDRTAVYTGENITANEYEIRSGALLAGDTLQVEYGGGSVNVTNGATASISKVTIKDSSGADVTNSKYNVTVENATVVVTARTLTVTGQNVQKTYDGNPFNLQSEYASRISSDKLPNHTVSVSLSIYQNGAQVASARDAGSYDIMLTNYSVKDGSGNDVTSDYMLSGPMPYKLGTLTITGAPAAMTPVTVTAKSQTWTYDGAAHEAKEYTLSSQLSDGDTISVSFDASSTITNVGTVANKISTVTVKDKNGAAVAFALNGQGSGKYNFTLVDGTLKVDPFKVTLTAVSAEKTYDGTALKNDNVKATALVSGHKFSVVKFAVTDSKGNLIKNGPVSVGTYTKKVTDVTIVDAKGSDVTKNYEITKVDGTLKVLQGDGSNNTKSPKTGDENNLGLWIGLLAASALIVLGIAGYFFFKNKKKAAPKPRVKKDHEK